MDFADYTDFPYPFREIRVIRAQKKKVTSDIILPLYHLLNYPLNLFRLLSDVSQDTAVYIEDMTVYSIRSF